MGKDYELLQLVKGQDAAGIFKLLQKNGRSVKTKLIGSNKKLNINYQDGDGMSALHQAALMGTTEIMQLLLENGAVVGLKDNKGMVALHYAAWQGKMEPVEVLLMWGSPVNEQALNGESPLHLACQHGHYEVVRLLLSKHADPSILSKHQKSPLDLACEFGRYRVSGLLIDSNVCQRMLLDNNDEVLDNKKTTCLHLAAKNGHSDIIRLLLQAGVNVNCSTSQGTCLHEAAKYGKTDVVNLLLDCGADVNKPNSYDQTALDIVHKFTTTRAAKDLKLLLKEASFAVQARAIKDHFNTNDSNSLPFKEGDYIIVLEQKPDGLWKGHVMNDGKTSKSGYFPSDHVVLVDSQAIAKSQRNGNPRRVPSPQVPDLITRSPGYNQPDRSSYGSIGTDESFPPPPSPLVQAKSRDHLDGVHGTPPPPYPGCNGQPYPNKLSANHIGNHVDWNGSFTANGDIRSSSPGKESPNGSNRNSAASSDSGRGVSTGQLESKHAHSFVNVHIANHRLSGQSYESGVSSRQSYHSTSSSSLGSLDRLEESGYSSQVNVAELVSAGLPDCEVLLAWLRDLHFEDYFNNFYQAGYDMPTISRMTPEDLTAIGVTKPGHRKRLKSEIAKLRIHDGIPDHKPNDLMDWLRLLSLVQYHDTLSQQGYADIDFVTEITWEDLEEIGIKKLGHQKKIMLAIARLKRITIGARRLSSYEHNKGSVEMLEPPPIIPVEPLADSSQHNQDASIAAVKPRSASGDNINSVGLLGPDMKTFLQKRETERISGDFTRHNSNSGLNKPEMVAIQVKGVVPRSSTTEALAEGTDMAGKVITYQSFQSPGGRKTSSSSDNADAVFDSPTIPEEPEDTVVAPRPSASIHPRVVIKPKPVAKIVAKTKRSSREYSPEIISIEKHEAENNSDGLKTSPVLNSPLVPNHAPKLLSPTDTKFDRAKLSPTAEIIMHMEEFREQDKLSPTPLSPGSGNKALSVTIPKHNPIYDQPSAPPPKSPKPMILPKTFAGGQPLGSPGHLGQGSVSPKFAPPPNNMNSGMVSPVFVCTQVQGQPQSPQKVSPTGKGKRAPPPPPKRSNSMQYESAIINTNEMRKVNNHSFSPTAPMSNANELRKVNSFSSGVPSGIVNANELRKVNSFSPTPPTFKMIHTDAKRQQASSPLRHPESTFSPPQIARKPANLNASPQIRSSPLSKVPSQDKEVPQQQAFATCVQSLSKRFGKNREETGSQELSPSDSEDIPPSPPPVAMEIITPKLHNYGIPSKLNEPANGVASRPGKPEIKSKPVSLQSRKVLESENSASENKRTAESERRRNESPKFESNNSSSGSVDSNTLPFANENVGTIKQRNAQSKPSVVQLEDTDGEQTVTLNSTMFGENCGTLKRTSNSLSYNNTSTTADGHQPSAHVGMMKPPVPKTSQQYAELDAGFLGGMPLGLPHPSETGDVLNDIDNMLQGLTDELDAMLDLE